MTSDPPIAAAGAIPFRLVPFAQPGEHAQQKGLAISGSLQIDEGGLNLDYKLVGDLDNLTLPSLAITAERRDQLWHTTCLELFLARSGDAAYWEFNLSPAGHWNVYRLEAYRRGLAPEQAYTELPFRVDRSHHPPGGDAQQQLTLNLRCPLPPQLRELDQGQTGPSTLEVGLTAVIQRADGTLNYWALHHPAAEPDFHHRGGFLIQIEDLAPLR